MWITPFDISLENKTLFLFFTQRFGNFVFAYRVIISAIFMSSRASKWLVAPPLFMHDVNRQLISYFHAKI